MMTMQPDDIARIVAGRNKLIYLRSEARLRAVMQAVQPIAPEAQHWLDSDAGPSYCSKCIRIARAGEFDLGHPIADRYQSYEQDDWEEAFYDGIDGGFDTISDSTSACEICGKTLSYILSDYGVETEIDYYRECPLVVVRGEDSYALGRLALNIWEGSSRPHILGMTIAINQAWRLAVRAALKERG